MTDSDTDAARMVERYAPWPRQQLLSGTRYADVGAFATILQDAADEAWWGRDSQLKYLSLHIDTRSGHFTLMDRDKNHVDPDRVLAAIDAQREWLGGSVKLHPPSKHPAVSVPTSHSHIGED